MKKVPKGQKAMSVKTFTPERTMARLIVPLADLSATEQRNLILDVFFDCDADADFCLALIDHASIDLAATAGDVKRIPDVIVAHYRVAKGRYDLDRAAQDLLSFPPIAARIKELKAQKATRRKS
jgi:hypothetical protein